MKINKIGLEILIVVILITMYYSYIPAWINEWSNFDSFYAFGFFMLAFQGYFFYKNWNSIKSISQKPSYMGIPFLLLGLILYVIGIKADYIYLANMSLPFFLIGIILGCYGIKILRFVLIPLILFSFAIPIVPLHRITMPLQLASASLVSHILNVLGITAHNEGTLLVVEKYRLAVVPGCSGLKSLSTLFFICLIYSYFLNISLLKKILFVASSFPLAFFMNVLRITFVSFYALYNGYNGLEKFHDDAGLVGYILSIAIVIMITRSFETKSEEKVDEI